MEVLKCVGLSPSSPSRRLPFSDPPFSHPLFSSLLFLATAATIFTFIKSMASCCIELLIKTISFSPNSSTLVPRLASLHTPFLSSQTKPTPIFVSTTPPLKPFLRHLLPLTPFGFTPGFRLMGCVRIPTLFHLF